MLSLFSDDREVRISVGLERTVQANWTVDWGLAGLMHDLGLIEVYGQSKASDCCGESVGHRSVPSRPRIGVHRLVPALPCMRRRLNFAIILDVHIRH